MKKPGGRGSETGESANARSPRKRANPKRKWTPPDFPDVELSRSSKDGLLELLGVRSRWPQVKVEQLANDLSQPDPLPGFCTPQNVDEVNPDPQQWSPQYWAWRALTLVSFALRWQLYHDGLISSKPRPAHVAAAASSIRTKVQGLIDDLESLDALTAEELWYRIGTLDGSQWDLIESEVRSLSHTRQPGRGEVEPSTADLIVPASEAYLPIPARDDTLERLNWILDATQDVFDEWSQRESRGAPLRRPYLARTLRFLLRLYDSLNLHDSGQVSLFRLPFAEAALDAAGISHPDLAEFLAKQR